MSSCSKKLIIGVVHLPALPGTASSHRALDEIIAHARSEAAILARAGFDGIIVENFGDAPFRAERVEPHTVSMMTRCAQAVAEESGLRVGINVLRNDAQAALAISAAIGGGFIRVNVHTGVYATDQGMICGSAPETLQYRQRLGVPIEVWADVHVKHAQPINQPDVVLAAEETAYRGRADAIILSGDTTGRPTDIQALSRVKKAIPDKRLFVGSGATGDTVRDYLETCDGVIVGTCLKQGGDVRNPIDPRKAEAFAHAART